jgi:hypothetical protein
MRAPYVIALLACALPTASGGATGSGGDFHRTSGLAVGGCLSRYQSEFGFGASLTSSYFAGKSLAIRLTASRCYLDALSNEGESYEWMGFWVLRGGLVSVTGMSGRACRLYAEGGVALALPADGISEDTPIGGYGLFGFEFFPGDPATSPATYYVELGGIGLGAHAEKAQGRPSYASGFLIAAGFRLYP